VKFAEFRHDWLSTVTAVTHGCISGALHTKGRDGPAFELAVVTFYSPAIDAKELALHIM